MGGGGGGGKFGGTKGGTKPKLHRGKQDKHIPGTSNFKQEAAKGNRQSILKADPQKLLDSHAGTGHMVSPTKERVDFGKVIGQFYDTKTGKYVDTTRGLIHYDSKGNAHIVPARPATKP
ncbi:hypothetical protein LJB86_02590 [Deltaproteobacteria bacterium OttesenSCG-928-M10]|nr:hypothetical protein [Deltaproteobacteria bacterium OttesenSCG-928-M10]